MAKQDTHFFQEEEQYVELEINGDTYKTHTIAKYARKKPYLVPELNVIRAMIPGTIQKILVKEGQSVSGIQPVMVLEAMKMMNTLTAPKAGKVKKIHVQTGDKVGKNQPLLEVE
jgi:biotin carboxyl carrier protein